VFTHLDSHPLLYFLFCVFSCGGPNNLSVLLPEVFLQQLDLFVERVERPREPISVSLCLAFEIVQLRREKKIVRDVMKMG